MWRSLRPPRRHPAPRRSPKEPRPPRQPGERRLCRTPRLCAAPGPVPRAVRDGCVVCCSPGAEEGRAAEGSAVPEDGGSPGRPAGRAQPGHRSYNLHERRRIGSMTGAEQAQYQKVPTDESEAQTLASADLDYMKSACSARAPGVVGSGGPGAVRGASEASCGDAGPGAWSSKQRRLPRAPRSRGSETSGIACAATTLPGAAALAPAVPGLSSPLPAPSRGAAPTTLAHPPAASPCRRSPLRGRARCAAAPGAEERQGAGGARR